MTNEESKELAQEMLAGLRAAVEEDYRLKAKLGLKVVVADKNGNPVLRSPRYLLRKMKRRNA